MYFTKPSKILQEIYSMCFIYCLENLRIEIDNQGNLKRIGNLQKNINITFLNQGFYYYQSILFIMIRVELYHFLYKGYPGNNSQFEFQASGAYIFRPVIQDAKPVITLRSL